MTGGPAAVLMTRVTPGGRLGWIGGHVGSAGTAGIVIAVLACVLLVVFTVTVLVLGFWKGSENDDGHEDGGAGGGGPKPPPGPGPSDPDPPWWAEFEREFARHVRARE